MKNPGQQFKQAGNGPGRHPAQDSKNGNFVTYAKVHLS